MIHLSTKFNGNIFIQSGNIDIFRKSVWRPPPSWIFMISEFGTFHHDRCPFLERCTKFISNISYNRWERSRFVSDVRLMTSCELTSGSVFGAPILTSLSRSHPKFRKRCRPLICACLPNLVQIDWGLLELFLKDCFFSDPESHYNIHVGLDTGFQPSWITWPKAKQSQIAQFYVFSRSRTLSRLVSILYTSVLIRNNWRKSKN